MLRVVIKLLLVALVLNATWRLGVAYTRFYRFEDALQQTAQFSDRSSDPAVCDAVMQAAAKLEVPVAVEAVVVRRGQGQPFSCGGGGYQGAGDPTMGGKLGIEAEYVEDVKLFPGYTRPWSFKPSAVAVVRP